METACEGEVLISDYTWRLSVNYCYVACGGEMASAIKGSGRAPEMGLACATRRFVQNPVATQRDIWHDLCEC